MLSMVSALPADLTYACRAERDRQVGQQDRLGMSCTRQGRS